MYSGPSNGSYNALVGPNTADGRGKGQTIQVDPDTGKWYVADPANTKNGGRFYAPNADKGQHGDESNFYGAEIFDPNTGDYHHETDWGAIIGTALALGATGVGAYAALAPAVAAPAAAGGAAAGSGAAAGGAGAGGFIGADIAGTEAAALGGGAAAAGAGGGAALSAYGPYAAGYAMPAASAGVPASLAAAGGGTAATVGTTGTLGKLALAGKTAQQVGSVFSNAAGADAQGRREDERFNLGANSSNNRAALEDAVYNLAAPSTLARQTAQGDAMAYNYQPASHTGSGRDLQLSGGVGPWMYGPNTKAAGQALSDQTLHNLQSGGYKLTPQMTPNASPSGREDTMGKAGMVLNILGALGSMYGGRR